MASFAGAGSSVPPMRSAVARCLASSSRIAATSTRVRSSLAGDRTQGAIEFADQAVHCASLTKKTGARRRPFMTLLLCLEPVRDAYEERAWIRPGERRVAGAVLHRWRARPGELGRGVVIDLRPANAHVGALREPVLVADVVLLCARARAANVRLKLLRLRVRRADGARADRYRQRHAPLLGFYIAFAREARATRG